MLETNIRIVYPGKALFLWTRRAVVQGTHFTPDLLEKACGKLRHRYGLAAVPHPTRKESLLVASLSSVKAVHLEDEEWELDVTDSGEAPQKYTLDDPCGKDILPRLLERALLVTLKSRPQLWNFDSPRHWYEHDPISTSGDFAAYRRYEITGVYVENEGVGIAIDVGTAFFVRQTLDYYFANDLPDDELKRRRKDFDRLRKRHGDHQGTLLYDHGDGYSKCYFREASGVTCATTGPVKVKGKPPYPSLSAYYKQEKPNLEFSDDTPAVRVSFNDISKPQPVAANRLRLRVMNDALPSSFRDVDKIEPDERRRVILAFWDSLGSKPFGLVAPGVMNGGLWCPSEQQQKHYAMPELMFGKGQRLVGPKQFAKAEYARYFRQRMEYLDKYGCYFVPPSINRTIYCAHPKQTIADIETFCADLEGALSDWTGCAISVRPLPYNDITDAVTQLRREAESGLVVFVLNEETAAYYEAAYQLPNWRIKRITQAVLEAQYQQLTDGAWDRRQKKKTLEQGQRKWNGFIKMNGLEIIQLLDTVPYRTAQTGEYEAQIVIDVSYDRLYFALSLLINRNLDKRPDFFLRSETYRKADHTRETINPTILADEIEKLFDTLKEHFDEFDEISSILFVRDGQFYGAIIDDEYQHETEGVKEAIARLKSKGMLTREGRADLVNLHKDTLKGLRFWEIHDDGTVTNPLEGKGIRLNPNILLIATTGDATLTKGTAQPYILQGNGDVAALNRAGEVTFLSAQQNWSSPSVAQRLPLQLKRTDEELLARSAQEIRRYH